MVVAKIHSMGIVDSSLLSLFEVHIRCTNAVHSLHTSVHKQICAARHVLRIATEFFSPKLTPSLPRCVKAGVRFYEKMDLRNYKTGGEEELELREKGA